MIWETGNMITELAVALLCLVFFYLLILLLAHVVLPKIDVIKPTNTKLTDEISEKVYCVSIVLFLALFILLYAVTGNPLWMLMSQLMTVKLMTGYDHYNQWVDESKCNNHEWQRFILCLVFYIIQPNKNGTLK